MSIQSSKYVHRRITLYRSTCYNKETWRQRTFTEMRSIQCTQFTMVFSFEGRVYRCKRILLATVLANQQAPLDLGTSFRHTHQWRWHCPWAYSPGIPSCSVLPTSRCSWWGLSSPPPSTSPSADRCLKGWRSVTEGPLRLWICRTPCWFDPVGLYVNG